MNSESYINRRMSNKLQIGFVRGGVSVNLKVMLASLRMEWAQRSFGREGRSWQMSLLF